MQAFPAPTILRAVRQSAGIALAVRKSAGNYTAHRRPPFSSRDPASMFPPPQRVASKAMYASRLTRAVALLPPARRSPARSTGPGRLLARRPVAQVAGRPRQPTRAVIHVPRHRGSPREGREIDLGPRAAALIDYLLPRAPPARKAAGKGTPTDFLEIARWMHRFIIDDGYDSFGVPGGIRTHTVWILSPLPAADWATGTSRPDRHRVGHARLS